MHGYVLTEEIKKKWAPVLDREGLAPIRDIAKRRAMTIMLENTAVELAKSKSRMLTEDAASNMSGGFPDSNTNLKGFDPILISMIRRSMPNLIAYDICGVQPMTGPTGLIFAMKSRYSNQAGTEALFNEANTAFTSAGLGGSMTGTFPAGNTTGLSNSTTYTTGSGMSTLTGEGLGTTGNTDIPEMAFSIDKVTATAVTRKLKAEYTIELAQDMKAIHGLDTETELANILAAEVLTEINREIIRTIYFSSVSGFQNNVANAGTFDLDSDSDGRWLVERFKGLFFAIEREANAIAKATRRGKGNIILCTSDVASALAAADYLHYESAYDANLQVDDTGSTFVGTIQGRYKCFIDPYTPTDSAQSVVVGYRGASPYDAGLFYCPYVPLQMLRAQDPGSMEPKIGFQTRYSVVANPFSNVVGNSDGTIQSRTNIYYRIGRILNLM